MPSNPFGFGRRTRPQQAASLGAAVAAIATAFLLLRPHQPSMAFGVLLGGGVVVLFGLFALLRHGRGAGSSPFERGMGGAADERDKALMTQTFAVGGVAAMLFMAADLVAIALGAPAEMAGACMMWATVLVMVIAYVVNARRM